MSRYSVACLVTASLLVVGVRENVAETLGLCRFLAFCASYCKEADDDVPVHRLEVWEQINACAGPTARGKAHGGQTCDPNPSNRTPGGQPEYEWRKS